MMRKTLKVCFATQTQSSIGDFVQVRPLALPGRPLGSAFAGMTEYFDNVTFRACPFCPSFIPPFAPSDLSLLVILAEQMGGQRGVDRLKSLILTFPLSVFSPPDMEVIGCGSTEYMAS